MKKVTYLLVVFALMLFWRQPVEAQPSGELLIGLPSLLDQTLHPTGGGTVYRKQYLEPLFDHLIGVDKDGKFDPTQSLAYKWETSPNLLDWTFYIREGVKFHDGDPLTIQDIKYTIERSAAPGTVTFCQPDFNAHVDRVEAIPPNKAVVHLKKPWPTMLYYLSTLVGTEGMILPKKYLDEKGTKYFETHAIGSGPYKLLEWKEGTHIKYVAQDSHWRVRVPKYKYLSFKLMPEEGTREAALRTGDLNVIMTGITRAEALRKDGFTIQPKNDGYHIGLGFIQLFRPEFPTNKLKVRQALIYAIDKEQILKQILMGQGTLIGNAHCMFTWSVEYKPYPLTPYDPKIARRLLTEAGYPDGFTIYLYSFATFVPETKLINEAIAGFWEAIGVKVKILEVDYSAFRPVYANQQDPPGPAAFVLAWPNRSIYSWRAEYHSKALFTQARDPKLDQLIEDFEGQVTTDTYIAASQKIMDYVLANAYASGICTTHGLFASSKSIPKWEMGKGLASFRWEYAGQK